MFCRIRVSFEYSKVSVFEKRGHFLDEKVSGKGSLLILENDHTSYLLHLSGGTGGGDGAHPSLFGESLTFIFNSKLCYASSFRICI